MAPTSTTPVIPADNIFVPIQTDNILPQIPIGQQHPVPRKGIEDNEYRTLHTNKFYANAFLGEQNQPVWTHPYVLWWGKRGSELGAFTSWGMNVGHSEEDDLVYGEGVPAKVCHPISAWTSYTANWCRTLATLEGNQSYSEQGNSTAKRC